MCRHESALVILFLLRAAFGRGRRGGLHLPAVPVTGHAGFGGGGHLGVVGAQSHVGPHLLVVDVPAWHRCLRSSEDTRPIRPTGEANASVGEPALVGLRPPDAGSQIAHHN